MIDLFSNPELIRNVRAQMRASKALTAAGICAAISLTTILSLSYASGDPPDKWGKTLLQIVLWIQAITLTLGGGIACLNAIHREKELNTFDFQRVTRLTPLELTLGKLFGAPVMAYFIAACFLPAGLLGALLSHTRPSFLLAAYVVMITGSITVHAMALVMSLLLPKGTNTAAVLILIYFLFWPGSFVTMLFHVGPLSPFAAPTIAQQTSWALDAAAARKEPDFYSTTMTDVFYGINVHHVPLAILLHAAFTAWFLLALARNVKRDPADYQLFSTAQSFGLVAFLNFLILGLYRWPKEAGSKVGLYMMSPLEIQAMFAGLNLAVLATIGFGLLRSRDKQRRLIREKGEAATSFAAALWPAPLLSAACIAVGIAAMIMIYLNRIPNAEWNTTLAAYRLAFFAAWLSKDILFLQWMNLGHGKRPLIQGVLIQMAFYVCASIFFVASGALDKPVRMMFASVFLPLAPFGLEPKHWTGYEMGWLAVLGTQIAAALLFAWLHRVRLQELVPHAGPAPASAAPLAAQ